VLTAGNSVPRTGEDNSEPVIVDTVAVGVTKIVLSGVAGPRASLMNLNTDGMPIICSGEWLICVGYGYNRSSRPCAWVRMLHARNLATSVNIGCGLALPAEP